MVMVSAVLWVFQTAGGRLWLGNVKTEIPLFGTLIRRLMQAQVFRTIGLLLQCRVGVLDTLELAQAASTNTRFRRLFDRLEEEITGGGQLSTAFEESGMVDPAMCQAIRTGEESGNLGGAISYCADILDESNTEMVKVVSKLLEPAILICMGGVVGTVAVSLFMPLFDLTSAMN
jgi:type II secretory pathway component PulF